MDLAWNIRTNPTTSTTFIRDKTMATDNAYLEGLTGRDVVDARNAKTQQLRDEQGWTNVRGKTVDPYGWSYSSPFPQAVYEDQWRKGNPLPTFAAGPDPENYGSAGPPPDPGGYSSGPILPQAGVQPKPFDWNWDDPLGEAPSQSGIGGTGIGSPNVGGGVPGGGGVPTGNTPGGNPSGNTPGGLSFTNASNIQPTGGRHWSNQQNGPRQQDWSQRNESVDENPEMTALKQALIKTNWRG
jgi:hypothetical protein